MHQKIPPEIITVILLFIIAAGVIVLTIQKNPDTVVPALNGALNWLPYGI